MGFPSRRRPSWRLRSRWTRRNQDQRVQHPAPTGHRIRDQPHPPEVDLQLPVRHPHRDRPTPTRPTHPNHEPVQRAGRHHHPTAGQQLADLDRGQVLPLHPDPDLLAVLLQHTPCRSMPGQAVRTDLLHQLAEELIVQLPFPAVAIQTHLTSAAPR
jgi:hypothetical protein